MSKTSIFFLILLLIIIQTTWSEDLAPRLMKINKSIRASALGDAVSAYPIDTDAIYYNPGGLTTDGYTYDNENHDYYSTEARLNHSSALVFGVLGYSNERKYSGDTKLSIQSFGIGVTGRSNTRWGMKYKDVDYTIAGAAGHGYSIDFGLMSIIGYRTSVGLLAKDIFKENVPVPGSISLGLAWGNIMQDVMLLSEVEYTRTTDKTVYKFGAEYDIMDSLILRAGYREETYCYGGEFTLPFCKIQYAATSGKAQGSNTIHQVGMYVSQ